MPIQDGVHFIDRAAVVIGNAPLGPVDDQVVALLVHGANLPLSFRFANADAAFEIMHNDAQLTDQLRFLGENHPDQPLVIRTAAAAPGWRQWSERSYIAVAELAP